MKIARILLANQPRVLRERILAAIANQPDIEIVGEVEKACDVEEAVARLRPDWLVVSLEESGTLSPQCYEILEEHPHTKILSISSRRNSATLCWASVITHSNHMEPSQKNLLGALRGQHQFVRTLSSRPQLFR